MFIVFKNQLGITREVKVGFSWTVFFFGGFPFFFRGMPFHAVAFLVAAVITWGVSNIILAFLGNKMTARYYLEQGYRPLRSPQWEIAANRWGVDVNLAQ